MRAVLVPQDFPRSEEIEAAAARAARRLGLDRQLTELHLVLDAPEFEEGGFWQIEREGDRVEATLYSSPRDVLTPPNWREAASLGLDEDELAGLDPGMVDPIRLDRWIYRNLLQLDDMLSHRIDPATLPRSAVTAFQICWDVWTDGRLKQRSLPGISLAERRRGFFRRFAAAGALLPRHWAIFHDLWEGRIEGQQALLDALDRLPPIR